MYNFPLQTGQEICLKDYDGQLLAMSTDESYNAKRYALVYKTTDFEKLLQLQARR